MGLYPGGRGEGGGLIFYGTLHLYWFHNDTSAENNSLNGQSNEPWING